MKTIDVLHLPKSLWLGRRGENQFRPIAVKWDDWHRDYPSATLSVIYHRPDGQDFIVATSTNSPLIWTPMQDVTTVSGIGELEMHLVDDPEIGISAHVETIIDDSRSNATVQDAPAWVDQVVADVAAEADRAEAAVESIGTQIDEAVAESVPSAVADYIEEHPVEVNETDPTVPAWAKQPNKPTYTASEVGALPDNTTIPAEVTEQTVSGWGFTKNTGTYSKPSGGIPKTDLADDVQTSLGKADTALQTAPVQSVNGKTGAVVLKTSDLQNDSGFQTAPFEIPITQSGDTFTTTASAADILAHADNCVAVFNGNVLEKSAYAVQGSNAQIIFAIDIALNGFTENSTYMVNVSNGTVSVSYSVVDVKPLPTVTAADNGKFLRVVSGEWAAAAVPSAESNSFGGGA